MRWIVLLVLMLALAACGGAGGSTPTAVEVTQTANETLVTAALATTTTPVEPTRPAAATMAVEPTDTAGVAPVGSVEEMTVEAADGLPIRATLLAPLTSGADPGVILLHMLGDDRTVWGKVGLAADLVAAGYAVLVVDMRGHGQTGGAPDWTLAADDLGRVWDAFAALETVDEARTAVVGASIGANMALRVGTDRPEVRTVVLLSPGLDYRGVTTQELLDNYGQRPLLLVASEDDAYSADSVRALAEAASGATVQMYEDAGHGTNMFAAEPELAALIVGWLDDHTAAAQ